MFTRKNLIALSLLAVAALCAGCQVTSLLHKPGSSDSRLPDPKELDRLVGPVSQKVEIENGWAVISPATGGSRQLGYVATSGGTAKMMGPQYVLVDAAEADLEVDHGMVVIETKKDGAPQYTGYNIGAQGLEPADYYAAHAPQPPLTTGEVLVVNKHLNALWHFTNGQLVKTYRVATGRQTQPTAPTWQDYKTNYFTPEGTFRVTDLRRNPPYTSLKPGEAHSYAGGAPDNPIGTRWMGFSVLENDGAGIWGIHGTSEPDKIGTWASDGCIRLRTDQAEELFESLVGKSVTLQIVGG